MSLNQWLEAIESTNTLQAWDEARIRLLGKSGEVTTLLKELGTMSPEDRKDRGAEINRMKEAVSMALEARRVILDQEALNNRLASETIDVTLPTRPETTGSIHPISRTIEEVTRYFAQFGFSVAEGPDVDEDAINFSALNIPDHHPARQDHDTFYMKDRAYVLRTHTSTVQIRTMRKEKPPIRILSTGRVYRCEHDATHTPMFHQVEGLVIDKTVTMAHLKTTLIDFCRNFFGVSDLPVRFRPSFFPFVEPGAEVDIGCSKSNGILKIGAGSDWLEILGCGMVHPNVLKNCGIDPEEYQGFAFGMGVERLAMLKYGFTDIRPFFEGDVRWHRQSCFSPFVGV
jgi:phenylalanyl-tRNA synthetase alpha chain